LLSAGNLFDATNNNDVLVGQAGIGSGRERVRERDCVRMRRRVGKGVGENDTHNCSIISHKVKNCCSILGVIQSRLSSSSGRAGQT